MRPPLVTRTGVAAAVACVLGIGAPAFAQDTDIVNLGGLGEGTFTAKKKSEGVVCHLAR